MKLETSFESIAGHLGLAAAILENVCDQAGINSEGTTLDLTNPKTGETYGRVSMATMIERWKELAAAPSDRIVRAIRLTDKLLHNSHLLFAVFMAGMVSAVLLMLCFHFYTGGK